MDVKGTVNGIVRAFRKLDIYYKNNPEECPQKRGEWTKAVFKELSDMGENGGYFVRHKHHDNGEWLWDLCWHQEDRSESLVEIPLAVECEWGKGPKLVEILKDFKKLLAARALIRVMFYDARQGGIDTAESIAEKLRDYVEKFNGKQGDTYLLIAAEGEESLWKYFRITDQGIKQPKLEQATGTKRVNWSEL